MPVILVLKKEPKKTSKTFHVFKGSFVMGGPIDMNVDMF